MGTAVVELTRKNFVAEMSKDSRLAIIRPFLPDGVDVERVIRAAQMAVEKTPELLKCTPQSIVIAIAKIQSWGLEIGSTAHLLPFGSECTPCADYKGLIELMIGSGAVRHVEARAVYEKDLFEYEYGLNERLVHRPCKDAKVRGPIVAAYCVLTLPYNQKVFEVMSAVDIDSIRLKHSRQWKSGPLTAWYAAKTVVRQVSKLIPKNPKLAKILAAVEEDARAEGLDVSHMVEDTSDAPQLNAGAEIPAHVGTMREPGEENPF
jgi:recombination protein RecT